jgi:diacylglycerol kinase (ATP)
VASPFGKAIVIANPRSGKGRVGKDPESFKAILASADLDFDLRLTERRGHATELAREALEEGHRFLVAVGGDGTIHEIVNGMMGDEGPRNPEAVLGLLAAGSGSDLIKTFGLPSDPVDAVKHLEGDRVFPIDIGRVRYRDDGQEKSRYFANIAEAGFGAEVVIRAEPLPRFLGRVRYLLSFWMSLIFFKIKNGKVKLDSGTYEGPLTNLVIANAQFFGGGMHIAPKAHPADGKFDVLIQKGTKRDYIAGITKVYKAEHLPSPVIGEHHSARVEVEGEGLLPVEADGEVLGTTPAVFELLPEALKIKI